MSSLKYKRNENIPWQNLEDHIILLNPGKQEAHELNSVGSRLWETLNQFQTIDDLQKIICSEYEVEEKEAREDAIVFLADLKTKGLIECQTMTT